TKEHTIKLIEKLRATIGDVTLRTTIITGYPGETEEQFAELLDFVKWAQFDALGCFPFFAEVDTPAAVLASQVPDDVKDDRTDRLMSLQQAVIFDKMDRRIGSELTVLVDETQDDEAVGRHAGQAPHIDSICRIQNCTAGPGQFIQTKITDRNDYDYIVEQI
nr:30S ribosomal protein S12 methylthiotransferase RimO [Planctomycetota bacterium]